MKVRRYDELLKARGYKVVEHTDYQGTNLFVKKHTYNTITCQVIKDTHGKAQTMSFVITSQISNDSEIQKQIDLDTKYLSTEANKIHECFELLRQMKSPKHIYF